MVLALLPSERFVIDLLGIHIGMVFNAIRVLCFPMVENGGRTGLAGVGNDVSSRMSATLRVSLRFET